MKCPNRHVSLLIVACLGFWVLGSGCATVNDFTADFSGGQSPAWSAQVASSTAAPGGNWLDHMLPSNAPGYCPECHSNKSMIAAKASSPASSGVATAAAAPAAPVGPPPQMVSARFFPVPTRPMFSPAPPEVLASNNNPIPTAPAQIAQKPASSVPPAVAQNLRGKTPPASLNTKASEPVRTMAPPAVKEELPVKGTEKTEEKTAPALEAEKKSDVRPTSTYRSLQSGALLPLKLNPPANATAISPASAQAESSDGWHPIVRNRSQGY